MSALDTRDAALEKASALGKSNGEKFAAARVRMGAPLMRHELAGCARRSYRIEWDHGNIRGRADETAYELAYLAAATSALHAAGLVKP